MIIKVWDELVMVVMVKAGSDPVMSDSSSADKMTVCHNWFWIMFCKKKKKVMQTTFSHFLFCFVLFSFYWSLQYQAQFVPSHFAVTVRVSLVFCYYVLIKHILWRTNLVDTHKHLYFIIFFGFHVTVSVYLPNCLILLGAGCFFMDMCSTCWHYNCII